jgi:hypothetical protein
VDDEGGMETTTIAGGRTATNMHFGCLLPPANTKKTMKNRLPATRHKKRDESSRKQTKGNACLFVYSGLNSPNFCFVARIFLWHSLSTENQRPQGHNGTSNTTEQSCQDSRDSLLFVVDVSTVPVFRWEITIILIAENK